MAARTRILAALLVAALFSGCQIVGSFTYEPAPNMKAAVYLKHETAAKK
jgi:hypothetical protein